ncbi:MAG: GyrI-like domain-containing protein [Anaerolineae bacterium]
MSKIDYKKQLKELYKPSAKKVVTVDVPTMNFLMVDGNGTPGTPPYREAIEALYSVAYTLKFMIKRGEVGIDYGVLPLEGLWWADDMSDFINDNKENWIWTMMIMQPDLITKELVQVAIKQVKAKKNLAAIDKVRFEPFTEGQCAQTLHIGPFSEEGPTVERVHAFIEESGNKLVGKHHEIYLSDIRRAAPENWKTIIRQPMG